jgi:hypothetical protein
MAQNSAKLKISERKLENIYNILLWKSSFYEMSLVRKSWPYSNYATSDKKTYSIFIKELIKGIKCIKCKIHSLI